MWEIELSLCYAMLSKNQKKAADILLEDPDAARTMTVRELAGQAGVGQATVIRMLQAAGPLFSGRSGRKRESRKEECMRPLPGNRLPEERNPRQSENTENTRPSSRLSGMISL